MAYRICSECPNPLTGKSAAAKTCSPKCRSARSRRIRNAQRKAGEDSAYPAHAKEISERVRGETPDVARHVIEEEIRPVVRESITADTLKAIADMVALTPQAVAALQEDLASDDATIRQRAYTLLMKYTVGHSAIVTPDDDGNKGPMHVHFELPRPGSDQPAEPVEEAEAVEVRECDHCHVEKPLDEFVANSYRCKGCFEEQQVRAATLIHEDD